MNKVELSEIVEPLILWYQQNKRDLPWRWNVTPYRVWISEIMLQQTRVEAVKDYYVRFLKRLPDIESLANIEEDELLKLWGGLGYYSRARNLQKAAKEVMENYHGVFPNHYDEIRSLKGIGDYTAGAISSLAFHLPVPCVDGNVLRVLSRVTGSTKDISEQKTKDHFKELITEVLTKDNVSDLNQGFMELGALVCLPNGKPLCEECPLKKYCVARKENKTEIIPVKKTKNPRKIERRTVFLLHSQDHYAIRKREEGLLAGTYEFPNVEGHLTEEEVKKMFFSKEIKPLPKRKHIFSHIEWDLIGYLIEVNTQEDNYLWVTKEELKDYSLSSAFQKYYPKEEK